MPSFFAGNPSFDFRILPFCASIHFLFRLFLLRGSMHDCSGLKFDCLVASTRTTRQVYNRRVAACLVWPTFPPALCERARKFLGQVQSPSKLLKWFPFPLAILVTPVDQPGTVGVARLPYCHIATVAPPQQISATENPRRVKLPLLFYLSNPHSNHQFPSRWATMRLPLQGLQIRSGGAPPAAR